MAIETSYTNARENLAALCDRAVDDREIIIIHRRNAGDVALIAADELRSLQETVHLFRSPKNAQRILSAIAHVQEGTVTPMSVEELRHVVGLDEEAAPNREAGIEHDSTAQAS